MIVETKEERVARGHPVGHETPYAAMGGLTGFSSLAEAYMRLDDSGIGGLDLKYKGAHRLVFYSLHLQNMGSMVVLVSANNHSCFFSTRSINEYKLELGLISR